MPIVEYNGQELEFPDSMTDEQTKSLRETLGTEQVAAIILSTLTKVIGLQVAWVVSIFWYLCIALPELRDPSDISDHHRDIVSQADSHNHYPPLVLISQLM